MLSQSRAALQRLFPLLARPAFIEAPMAAFSTPGYTQPRREVGRVKWFDAARGMGFIMRDNGTDIFVHFSALPQGVDTLAEGQKVEFSEGLGPRGTVAKNLTPI